MRDQRFVTEHRGGTLQPEQHRQLMAWARACSEHVIPLLGTKMDDRLSHALTVSQAWENGEARTGSCMKAAQQAHAAAREYTDPVYVAVARSIGQGVATAHMADHSLGAALYALRAVKLAGGSVEEERAWQTSCLETAIREMVLSALQEKERHFRLN